MILSANEKITYNSMYGPFLVMVGRILANFSPSQIPKTVQLSTGKINIYAPFHRVVFDHIDYTTDLSQQSSSVC